MCIIVIKPKDKELQKRKVLKTCFERNSDGAGYMFAINNKVIIKKGFMTFNEFYKSVIKDYTDNNLKDNNLVMHFRIGTSGESKLGCTHPFPISDEYESLEKLEVCTSVGVCHNGVISNMNSRYNKYSDTEIYIKNVLAPIMKLNKTAYLRKDIQNMILLTTNSKLCILDNLDNLVQIGEFVVDDGYYYSNSTYKPYTPPKYSYNYDYNYNSYNYNSYNYIKTPPINHSSNANSKTPPIKVLKKEWFFRNNDRTKMFVIKTDNKFYYDKDNNIYEYDNHLFKKIMTNAIIYDDKSNIVTF